MRRWSCSPIVLFAACNAGPAPTAETGAAAGACFAGVAEGAYQHVERYDGTLGVTPDFVRRHQAPVVQVLAAGMDVPEDGDTGSCSGTLIAPDIVLTAGHCPGAQPRVQDGERLVGAMTDEGPDPLMLDVVRFRFQAPATGDLERSIRTVTVPVVEVIEQLYDPAQQRDHMLLRLAYPVGHRFGVNFAKGDVEQLAKETTAIALIGHPRRDCDPGFAFTKVLSAGTLIEHIVDPDGNVSTKDGLLQRGWLGATGYGSPGASGSGLLDQDGFVRGIHTNGFVGDSVPAIDHGSGSGGPTIAATLEIAPRLRPYVFGDVPLVGDVDGDGVVEPIVYDPSTHAFSVARFLDSTRPFVAGLTVRAIGRDAVPVVGDFDGDGRDDLGVFDPHVEGQLPSFSARRASGEVLADRLAFGRRTDRPVVGDFDGDGVDDLSVVDLERGTWSAYDLRHRRVLFHDVAIDAGSGTPLAGDLDGDGVDELVVHGNVFEPSAIRPNFAVLRVRWRAYRRDGRPAMESVVFGQAGDLPLLGDLDGDGKANLVVWRADLADPAYPYNRSGFVWLPEKSAPKTVAVGLADDVPLIGNLQSRSADAGDDLVLWNAGTGEWFAHATNSAALEVGKRFGDPRR